MKAWIAPKWENDNWTSTKIKFDMLLFDGINVTIGKPKWRTIYFLINFFPLDTTGK